MGYSMKDNKEFSLEVQRRDNAIELWKYSAHGGERVFKLSKDNAFSVAIEILNLIREVQ